MNRENTHSVDVWLPACQIPALFDQAKTLYLYNACTRCGQWCSSMEEIFRQWQQSDGNVVLKLFEVGVLPGAALTAVRIQGITLPYWRDSLRALPGWIVCRAIVTQKDPGSWSVAYTDVVYTEDRASFQQRKANELDTGTAATGDAHAHQ